jgi:ribosomal protein S18 acetylase RimI-like enzyme
MGGEMNSPEKKALVRRMKIEDAEEICGILSAITQTPVNPDFKKLVEKHARKSEDACLVAERGGKVIGFMISYILTLGFGMEKSAWIATLGVNPDYMGQGIGEGLAEELFRYYKKENVSYVYTSVRWDSPDLLSFFKTLGFDRSNFINLRKSTE